MIFRRIIFLNIVLIFSGFLFQHFSQPLLSIEEAVKISLSNNYQIKIAENLKEISENNHSLGAAGFLPSLDAAGSYTENIDNTTQEYLDGRTVDRTGAESSSLSAGLALNWTIFDGLGMFASLDRLKELRKLGEENFKNVVESNISEVIITYYDIVRQKEVLEVISSNIIISEERVRIAEDEMTVGTGSRFQLRQAQVDLNEDRSSLLREELRLEQLKTDLNLLMGRGVGETFSTEDTIIVRNDLQLDGLENESSANNRIIRIAELNRNLSGIDIRLFRSEWFPRISLRAGLNYLKSESEAGFISSNRNQGINYGVTASFNIFNGLETRRRIENSQVLLKSSQIELEEAENNVFASLRNTFLQYKNSLQLITLEKENLSSAEANLDIALESLKLGSISPLEFRETQRQLVNAKSRLVAAQFEAKQAETFLLQISGTLLRNI
jgi:outer membrane protein